MITLIFFHSLKQKLNHRMVKLLFSGSFVSESLCDPMDCRTPGFPVFHHVRSLLELMFIESVIPSNHLILCWPLLLLPSIFPSNMIFSDKSALCIR